jgi:O-acetylhomoserine/O-acetylserine sulfhydrylase-like pyridoxal-dependent enzyme
VTGFSTRAIRASPRAPRIDQHPTSAPICQTVTFASDNAELAAAGIGPGLLRCSIGLEDVDDVLADFTTGLEAARGATPAPATA